MRAEPIAFVGRLVFRVPVLLAVLEDHLEDNDREILSHLLLADITSWLADHVDSENEGLAVRGILAALEKAYTEYDELSELISVSFLENLPRDGEKGGADQVNDRIKTETAIGSDWLLTSMVNP